jgi:predicted RNA-binding Zn-ribbon protein involved in translation (DUF1610 family)
MSACHFCGGALDPKMRIVKDTVCPHCGRDLHACVQCRHYDRHAHNQCREPNAEWVTDRERRNFCDYYALSPAGGKGAGVPDREKAARSKLDGLFSPGPPKTTPGEARSKLDALFQKPTDKDPEPDDE